MKRRHEDQTSTNHQKKHKGVFGLCFVGKQIAVIDSCKKLQTSGVADPIVIAQNTHGLKFIPHYAVHPDRDEFIDNYIK